MNYILTALVVLGAIAIIAAVVLYVCSKRFAVTEDPRIGEVAQALPQANCGGCGFAGCSGLAAAIVKAADNGSIEGLACRRKRDNEEDSQHTGNDCCRR